MHSTTAAVVALQFLTAAAILASGGEARVEPRDGGAQLRGEQRPRLLQQAEVGAGFGSLADCGRHPYIVSLRDENNTHVCSGILVDQRMVLTAARCVKTPKEERHYLAVVGACSLEDRLNETNEGGIVEIFLTKRVIVHENWTGNIEDGYDIALMELDGLSNHPRVSLASSEARVRQSDQVAFVGWGTDGEENVVQDLQLVRDIQVVRNEFCDEESGWPFLKPSMMCTMGSHAGLCRGDNGSPLIELFAPNGDPSGVDPRFDVVVGITSFWDKEGACSEDRRPDVYTRVSDMHEWIDEKIEALSVVTRPAPPMIVAASGLVHDDIKNGTADSTNGTTNSNNGTRNPTNGTTDSKNGTSIKTDDNSKNTEECALCYKNKTLCFFCGS